MRVVAIVVVASPAPKEIIELEAIKGLVGKQLIVACGGEVSQ